MARVVLRDRGRFTRGMHCDPMERFNEKWKLDGDGCRIWTASQTRDGYGQFGVSNGSAARAHRWLFQQVHNWSDEQMPPEVCHSCDKPLCVREQCLFPGTHKDNAADMAAKGRGRNAGTRGEDHPSAWLTECEVFSIRCSPAKAQETAELYGVSRSAVYAIQHRRCWTHI